MKYGSLNNPELCLLNPNSSQRPSKAADLAFRGIFFEINVSHCCVEDTVEDHVKVEANVDPIS